MTDTSPATIYTAISFASVQGFIETIVPKDIEHHEKLFSYC